MHVNRRDQIAEKTCIPSTIRIGLADLLRVREFLIRELVEPEVRSGRVDRADTPVTEFHLIRREAAYGKVVSVIGASPRRKLPNLRVLVFSLVLGVHGVGDYPARQVTHMDYAPLVRDREIHPCGVGLNAIPKRILPIH